MLFKRQKPGPSALAGSNARYSCLCEGENAMKNKLLTALRTC